MDEATPPTEPQGALVPPRKPPSTAVALASPAPEPSRHARHPSSFRTQSVIGAIVQQTLDTVDTLADAIADGLGLRSR